MKFRLYCGLVKGDKWYSYSEVIPLKGGALTLLEGTDKSGTTRLLNLVKGSITSLFTEDGEELKLLSDSDYLELRVVDTWKIGYEQIKLVTKEEYPVIPENFFCPRCSRLGAEHYTKIEESWQKLVDDGLIDEIFLESPSLTYEVELPEPIEIPGSKTIVGGIFDKLVMQHLSLGNMLSVQKNSFAMQSEANMAYTTWDNMIVKIPGLSDKDYNILKRVSDEPFSKRFLSSSDNIAAIEDAEFRNMVGMDARDRRISCNYCHEEIGGYLDFSNFFSPLLQRKSIQNHIPKIEE